MKVKLPDALGAGFLPMSRTEMEKLGWTELDVLIVTGDACIDHPAFGAALLGRWLAAHGYRVGLVAQPAWRDARDIGRLGRPRLFVGITAGALDSMLAHYTAFRKKRGEDAYTPGGRAGARPNRATIVYANLARQAFAGVPVVLGGIEASMRRVSHYDFWSDSVRQSILLDSKAELLVYGMGERAVLEVARRLSAGGCGAQSVAERLRGIPGTAWVETAAPALPAGRPAVSLPSHEEIVSVPAKLMEATLALEGQVHQGRAWALQRSGGRWVVLAEPAAPLSEAEMDALYALPFSRRPHPAYREPIPAAEMLEFSVTSHRGCAGGCAFCALALHQGRRIQSRSRGSILAEARTLAAHPSWRGAITDVGGPTANMWGATCASSDPAGCRRASCLWPAVCRHFVAAQESLAGLLREVAALPGVRHVRTASGVRHDLALREPAYVRALVGEFTGGQLKLAPEHCSDRVLALMRKPHIRVFERFLEAFRECSSAAGKEQYVLPYLVSALPGCTDADMTELAGWLRKGNWRAEQVQCFVPTPGTVATAMYHAGIDTRGRRIAVARSDAARLRQHRLLTAALALRRGHGERKTVDGRRKREDGTHIHNNRKGEG